ncbi:ATP-binding protein [Natranaerobius thermophilus]|uniref:histidine kinase n=1 Tax=Natranaerobius thermophilus (strain ATCC BAA-1301 / DSM 18059 / JW/NM-WN-LF) TaxID=457570 RepID=B2A443_NATTJ|nr:ATP-binding protein [Natranaerobius thermophilus]ACB86449.1 multi-sensor signal transduction histidine kinase [Natranaerobius thermophilus JW/NM-WN-LF]
MFKTVQWKLVVIYLLLVLLAMELISVYLLQSLDQYYLDDYSERMSTEAELAKSLLQRHMTEEQDADQISQLLGEFGQQAHNEITILDENGRVLATSSGEEELQGNIIVEEEITRALAGSQGSNIRINPNTNIRQKSLAIPIESGNQVIGAVYLVGSLERVDNTLSEIRTILFTGTLFAMLVTALLGIILSKTITKPVKVVTRTAQAMAQGDFNQRIDVKSDDEIGNLGRMFNHLASRLDSTLKEISSEKGKIEAILTQMSDGVIAVNSNKEIIHINPAAERMLNVEREKLRGQCAKELLSKFFTDEEFDQILKGETNVKEEKNLTTNEDMVVRAQLVPFKSEEKQYEGVIIALNDITEQEKLIQMRQEFVANVSHELRTPLTSVKSYVETLLDGAHKDDEIAPRFLKVVQQETDRMVTMVKDLLVLSQLDRKEPIIECRDINFMDVLDRSISAIESLTKDQKIELHLDYKSLEGEYIDVFNEKPEFIRISGDSDKLTQVFTNILENAIKYSPSGEWIQITVEDYYENIKISVKDNGMGIPAEDLPRIFERFYRVEKARSRARGGSGLGLAISREIIRNHGGDINVSSQEGRGTEVIVYLPKNQEVQYELGAN